MVLTVSFAVNTFKFEVASFLAENATIDAKMVNKIVPVLTIICLTNIVDMVLQVCIGCLRALRIQGRVAYESIFCFMMLSIPTAYYLAFENKLGIMGLWLG